MTAPLYVAAREVLLDALDALGEQREALILAGAQAIYVHTGSADLAVAEFTTDGDLVVDPAHLKALPRLSAAMEEARFPPDASQEAGSVSTSSTVSQPQSPSISSCRRLSRAPEGAPRASAITATAPAGVSVGWKAH